MLDADQAKERLQEILSRTEYTIYGDQSKSLLQTWWDNAKEWMAEQLEKLFPSYEATSAAAGPVLTLIIVLVVIALGVAAYFIIRNTQRSRAHRDKSPLQSMKELDWTSDMHLSEALKQEGQQEYSLAARHLFLALLLYFHKKEWLEARIWKTNWEYYDELRKVNKEWADQFYHLARVFDEVTYGERQLEKQEYDQFRKEAYVWLEEPRKSMEG
ncbi:DUF4129 domain-containing protein [Siminovitchia acidinfaciens]|uniref:DUF4129 domain-containing protein n=1 Tax=Siminovitchia acidinfaciens TaxID=2321395 RepID=A0A429Y6Z2_9BACI|nr:DUF4129 domain-containing protein [Siminovitchia acidinfaciens]RST77158.1 DUF4129 domain-containing protein [Siminovitchia acidinfaciens]